MRYAEKQDLIDRFGRREIIQLTDRTNTPAATIDDTVVNRALDDAQGLIDSYIGKAYALPLAAVPAILVKLCADIARFYLRGGEGLDKDASERLAYNDAVAYLRDVSRGLIQPTDATSGQPPAATAGGQMQASAPARVMSRDTLRGY